MKQLLAGTVLILSLASCGPSRSEYQKLEDENKALAAQNALLTDSLSVIKEELNGYRFSPAKLCANIQELFAKDDLEALKRIAEKLEKYHPESQEVATVKNMCQKLIDNRQKKKEEEERKRMQAVNKLKKKFDDVSGITWYENSLFTHYNDINSTSIYIGKNETSIWLRTRMSYAGSDWIFFEKAYLSYDGNTQEIYFNKYKEKETDNSGGKVWEWIDVSVNTDLLSFLRKMIDGKSVKMRLSGKYTKTKNLSAREIQALKDVLLAYDVLQNGN